MKAFEEENKSVAAETPETIKPVEKDEKPETTGMAYTETGEVDYRAQLEINNVLAFVPRGNSMWPMLKNRKQTVIIVKKEGKLKKYDVAFYVRKNGKFVLHRVLATTDDGYVMCGDSLIKLEPVEEDAVFGVMKGFYRKKNYIEASDPEYLAEVGRWYASEKRRRKKIKRFYFFVGLRSKLAAAKRKIAGNKNDKSE